jgi:hypothetical protein
VVAAFVFDGDGLVLEGAVDVAIAPIMKKTITPTMFKPMITRTMIHPTFKQLCPNPSGGGGGTRKTRPHFGQDVAASETEVWQSGQVKRAF